MHTPIERIPSGVGTGFKSVPAFVLAAHLSQRRRGTKVFIKAIDLIA